MRKRQAGLTLIEGIVAAALAVVLGFLMLQFISSSLGAHRKGQMGRTAQAGTRSMIDQLVGELRSSSVPPLSSPVSISPVFWPGVWGGDQEPGNFGAFYVRDKLAEDGKDRDRSSNRLFYIRAADSSATTSLDPLARYALVELLVPETNPGVLERRVHSLIATPPPLKLETVKGAKGVSRQGWTLDLAAISAPTASASPDILYDAGPDSRISFRVSHLQFEPASDPGRTRYPEVYDPGVFRIEVAVAFDPQLSSAVHQPWPTEDQWQTLRSETTELRIPSVRSN